MLGPIGPKSAANAPKIAEARLVSDGILHDQ